jgi:hypothetical protein
MHSNYLVYILGALVLVAAYVAFRRMAIGLRNWSELGYRNNCLAEAQLDLIKELCLQQGVSPEKIREIYAANDLDPEA